MLIVNNMLTKGKRFFGVGILLIISQVLISDNEVQGFRVDYEYCKPYIPDSVDDPGSKDPSGRPIIFIGATYSKKYYLMNVNYTVDFFEAAYSTCARFDLDIASVKTACEYGIVEKWFLSRFPTDYSIWIGGFRLGDSTQPPPLWVNTGEPLDFSQFNLNAAYTGGPYPPGGYSPIVYPWANCLSVSRNCPQYTAGPTNPCQQSPTYPDIQFMWMDCRSKLRIMCEEISYSKEGSMNEIE